MNRNYMISVDWLQVYCTTKPGINLPTGGSIKYNYRTYDIEMTDRQTAMFKTVTIIKSSGLCYAVLESEPRSSKLTKSMVLLKLENRVLYSSEYISILYDLISMLNLTYKGITRLDLAYDCTMFADGRRPSRFINNFLTKPDTEQGGIYRKGSDEFTCHGKKAAGSPSKINYISFGSPKSRVRAYIYDKTIELQEVKDKPWIREAWAENGIDASGDHHVFRSEISIKSEGMDILNMSTGQLFRLSIEYMQSQVQIEKLFHFYAKKYLFFAINEGQKYRKNYRPLGLFMNKPEITCKPMHISKSADTGRMEKICYNKLEKLSETYSDLAEYRRIGLQEAMNFLKELQGIKSDTVRQQEYKWYLNSLLGRKFEDEHIIAWFDNAKENNSIKDSVINDLTYLQYEREMDELEYRENILYKF